MSDLLPIHELSLGDVADVAGLVALVIEGAKVVIGNARRDGDDRRADAIHEALLKLHRALDRWVYAASLTNERARLWRDGLPASAGRARATIADPSRSNAQQGRNLKRLVHSPAWEQLEPARRLALLRRAGPNPDPAITLGELLAPYAPSATANVGHVLRRRIRLVHELAIKLELANIGGGVAAVNQILDELDSTAGTLARAHTSLAECIRREFPLGAT